MSDFYVLIFSKYSNSSRQIMSIINSLPDFPVNYFSIDHQKNRQQILDFKDLQIKSVPCLLKCSSLFGEVKKFEGNDCFNFFNRLKKNQVTQQQPSILLQTPPQQHSSSIPIVSNENNNVKQNNNNNKPKKNKKVIEHIEEDIPQNSSNIDEVTISDEEEAEKNDKEFIDQILPKNNNDKGNLLALATAMQKSRMSEDESLNSSKLKNMMPSRI
jgi:hypothetical protein